MKPTMRSELLPASLRGGCLRQPRLWQIVPWLLAVLLTVPAHAGGIAFVDAQRLLAQAPQGEDEIRLLESEFAERKGQIEQRFEAFQKRELDLQKNGALDPESVPTKTEELRIMRRQLQRARREYNEDYAGRRDQGLLKLEKIITKAIIAVAKREKLDVVLQQAIYASPKIDLTAKVLKELKKRHKK